MKKIFTLVVMAAMAISVNAQTSFATASADDFKDLVNFEASTYKEKPSLSYVGAGEIGSFTLFGVNFSYKNSSNKSDFIRMNEQGILANGKNLIFEITTDNANEQVEVEVAAKGGTAPAFEIQSGTGTIGECSTDKVDGLFPTVKATLTSGDDNKITVKETTGGFILVSITKKTNGINDVTVKKADADAQIFNLAGQRVSKDAKGLLIQNGKKIIKK